MKIAFVATLALAALAGCNQADGPAPAAGTTELTLTDGKLVLPAVSGNPAAAYFVLTNGTKEVASLAAASVDAATKAEMHETSGSAMRPIDTLNIGPGATVTFERGGKHLMVFGARKSLKPGDTTKLTLTFSGGKTISTPLMVESAGGAGTEHEGAH